VMSVLQSARAYVLGLPLESAHSWGLNKAIFYAAAKRGFKGESKSSSKSKKMGESDRSEKEKQLLEFKLGDDIAFRDKMKGSKSKPVFSIGGKAQTEEDYLKQVKGRFNQAYTKAWDEALDYVRGFDKQVLLSQSRFFSEVYRPKRDEFAQKWSKMSQE
jgi:hypothetical protein